MLDLAVTWRGRGFEQKFNERYPLIFVEKSPLKIVCINLETPCIMRLLVREIFKNRHRYHPFRKFFSIQRRITR